jgi:hypothetical protein
LAALGRAPTPEQGARLSLSKINPALKAAGRQRNIDTRATEIQAILRRDHLNMPPAVAAAFGATTTAAVHVIAILNIQIAELEAVLAAHFETHPDADIYRSLPGLGVVLGARVLGEFGDDPNRSSSAKCPKNLRRNLAIDRRVGSQTCRAGPPRPQQTPLRRARSMGVLRVDPKSGCSSLLRPAPRQR